MAQLQGGHQTPKKTQVRTKAVVGTLTKAHSLKHMPLFQCCLTPTQNCRGELIGTLCGHLRPPRCPHSHTARSDCPFSQGMTPPTRVLLPWDVDVPNSDNRSPDRQIPNLSVGGIITLGIEGGAVGKATCPPPSKFAPGTQNLGRSTSTPTHRMSKVAHASAHFQQA